MIIKAEKPELKEKDKAKFVAKISRVKSLYQHVGMKDYLEYLEKLEKGYKDNLEGNAMPKEGISFDFFVGYNRGALASLRDSLTFFKFYSAAFFFFYQRRLQSKRGS